MKAYRTDIDGLRAIAVLAVVYFHLNPRKLDGGFLGVDMFFVISGFLITSLTWAALQQQTFSFVDFYARRIRRLFPALFTVLLVFAGIILWLGLPQDVENYGRSSLATTFYISNIYFWSVSDYFNEAAKNDPLLHTWSLSVEEQFYLVFPVLLLAVFRFARDKAFWVLLLAALAFLALSEFLLRLDPSMAFYISPSRFWQFLAGGLILFLPLHRACSARVASLVSLTGLLVLLACFKKYSDAVDYPGLNSVIPTLATAALILFGAVEGNRVSAFLSTRPLRFMGRISYSVYLWHWPLIVVYKLYFGEVDKPAMAALFCLTVILGYLSWRFVEEPFRHFRLENNRKKLYLAAAALMLGTSTVSAIYIINNGFDQRYAAEALPIVKYLDRPRNNLAPIDCFWSLEKSASFPKSLCLKQEKTRPNVLLLGDSHMEHYAKAIGEVFPEVTFSRVTGPGCRVLYPVKKSASCSQLMGPVFSEYLNQYRFDTIVISGRWKLHEAANLEAALDRIRELHRGRIVLLGPIIEYKISFPRLVLRYIGSENMDTNIDAFNEYSNVAAVDRKLQGIASARGIDYFSILDTLCDDGACTHMVKGEPVHVDYGHVTYYGALHIMQALRQSGLLLEP